MRRFGCRCRLDSLSYYVRCTPPWRPIALGSRTRARSSSWDVEGRWREVRSGDSFSPRVSRGAPLPEPFGRGGDWQAPGSVLAQAVLTLQLLSAPPPAPPSHLRRGDAGRFSKPTRFVDRPVAVNLPRLWASGCTRNPEFLQIGKIVNIESQKIVKHTKKQTRQTQNKR